MPETDITEGLLIDTPFLFTNQHLEYKQVVKGALINWEIEIVVLYRVVDPVIYGTVMNGLLALKI